jgi:ABC-type uncharacterized transport system substrate-binding protein
MKSKGKMDISRVLRIILVRSLTYLSLLVIVVFFILYLRKANRPSDVPLGSDAQSQKMIAIIDGRLEHKDHIKGLRDGLLYKGINVPCIAYSSLDDISEESFIYYVFGKEKVIQALQRFPESWVVGYAGIHQNISPSYTGIFSEFDWAWCFSKYREVLPQIRTVGLLYTESNQESREQIEAIQRFAENDPHFVILPVSISQDGGDLKEKLNSLIAETDVFLGILQDKNIEDALSIISSQCLSLKKPFIGGGRKGAQMGALIALEYNQELLGRKASEIIRLLVKEHKEPGQISITFPQPEVFINLSTSYKLGLQFPPHIQNSAKEKFH